MVQGPCAHVVLHDKIYVDFTDLLTVIEFTKRYLDTKHSTPDCTVTEYVQSFRSIAQVVTKRALLTQTNIDLFKSWSNQKICILIRCTHDNNLELIQSLALVVALFVFSVLAPW
jgi:hypothetical protein